MESKVEFLKKMPSKSRLFEALGETPEKFLIIYDAKLKKAEGFSKWLKEFRFSYPVSGGESLKDLNNLSSHIKKFLRWCRHSLLAHFAWFLWVEVQLAISLDFWRVY